MPLSKSNHATAESDGSPSPVSTGELGIFVGKRSLYYLKKWEPSRPSGPRLISFNLAGLIFGPYWALVRRMYLAATIALSPLIVPVLLAIIGPLRGAGHDPLGLGFLYKPLLRIDIGAFNWAPAADDLIWVACALFFGFFGNRLYLAHAINRIRAAKERGGGTAADLAAAGGVRWRWLFVLLGSFAVLAAFLTLAPS